MRERSVTTYPLFLLLTAATIASPGPGVVLTLSNALRHGLRGAYGGILGLATGSFVVAAASASGLGALLAISSPIFTAVRFVGAAYLVYLGVRLWHAEPAGLTRVETQRANTARQFLEGIGLQLSNPNAIVFFLAVFPQFVDLRLDHAPQFTRLVASYVLLVVIIHSAYALLAKQAGTWLRSNRYGHHIDRVAGAAFVAFGATLAVGRR